MTALICYIAIVVWFALRGWPRLAALNDEGASFVGACHDCSDFTKEGS